MDICLLNDSEVGRLLNYAIPVNHGDHIHISAKEAMERIKREELDLIQDPRSKRWYVTEAKMHYLERKPSAGIDTIQRVRAAQPLILKVPR